MDKDIVNQAEPEAYVHLKQDNEVAKVVFLKGSNQLCNFREGFSKHAMSSTLNYKQA